jgi:hypothetical protein
MAPLAQVEDQVSQVESLEDARPQTRWTIGADVGVGAGGLGGELVVAVDAGFRQDRGYVKVQFELIEATHRTQGSWCPLVVGAYCPSFLSHGLARGALLIGVPVEVWRNRALDVGLGPAWSLRRVGWFQDPTDPDWTATPLLAAINAEIALRVPLGQGTFARFTLSTFSVVGRNPPGNPQDGYPHLVPSTVVPGGPAVALRVGLTR